MIWLIGGTSESAAIALALDQAQLPYCVTVTTEAGRSLYPSLSLSGDEPRGRQSWVRVGCLPSSAMLEFIQTQGICVILDASHPFASVVSEGAIAAARAGAIAYLRFERPDFKYSDLAAQTLSLPALLQSERLCDKRVLLILGYRLLDCFRSWQTRATLFARILPSPLALAAALEAGFDPRRLIALRPPIAPELEKALWRQWQVSVVVAKASGSAGGEDVKRAIAQELGIELILLGRPRLVYPQQTSELGEAIAFARSRLT